MYVLTLNGSSLKPATQPHPWPSPSKENKSAVNAEGKKNMDHAYNHWYYSWLWHLERLHKDKLTFNYEHKHSVKKSIVKITWVEKTNKASKTDGRFLWNVAQLAENYSLSGRGSFPRSDCPCGCLLSFMVLLSPKTPAAISSREIPTTTVFHTWDLAPLTMTSLGWCGKQKCPRQPSMKRKVFFHRGYFGPHVLWHLLYTFFSV